MRTPRAVEIEITARCNLRCRYCYFFDNPAVPYADLPTQEWLRFFRELGQCGVMKVTLEGGEPFLRADLRPLLEAIVAARMRFEILSNGTLIDDRISAFLAKTGRCDRVQVSLDGSCAAVHDTLRGTGSFEKAVEGIRSLQRHRVPIDVRLTLTPLNIGDLDRTLHFLMETLSVRQVSTNAAGYLGSCRLQAGRLQLGVRDRMQAMDVLRSWNRKYRDRLVATAGPQAEEQLWQRMEQARRCGAPPFPEAGHLTGCGCPFSHLAVRADGTFIPCVLLPHLAMGRINKDPLPRVWQRHPVLRELRERRRIPMSQFAYCRGCPYVPYCTGNCPALAFAHLGELHHPAPDACLRDFLKSGGRLEEPE